MTLDDCLQRFGWKQIDVLKIDAEGEEASIIEGGRRFFAEQSPLILYEVKAGEEVHLELVENFRCADFDPTDSFPGLDLLVPFDAAAKPDAYLLNPFCCKKDRAELLADRGLLLDSPRLHPMGPSRFDHFLEDTRQYRGKSSWRRYLRSPIRAPLAADAG